MNDAAVRLAVRGWNTLKFAVVRQLQTPCIADRCLDIDPHGQSPSGHIPLPEILIF